MCQYDVQLVERDFIHMINGRDREGHFVVNLLMNEKKGRFPVDKY